MLQQRGGVACRQRRHACRERVGHRLARASAATRRCAATTRGSRRRRKVPRWRRLGARPLARPVISSAIARCACQCLPSRPGGGSPCNSARAAGASCSSTSRSARFGRAATISGSARRMSRKAAAASSVSPMSARKAARLACAGMNRDPPRRRYASRRARPRCHRVIARERGNRPGCRRPPVRLQRAGEGGAGGLVVAFGALRLAERMPTSRLPRRQPDRAPRRRPRRLLAESQQCEAEINPGAEIVGRHRGGAAKQRGGAGITAGFLKPDAVMQMGQRIARVETPRAREMRQTAGDVAGSDHAQAEQPEAVGLSRSLWDMAANRAAASAWAPNRYRSSAARRRSAGAGSGAGIAGMRSRGARGADWAAEGGAPSARRPWRCVAAEDEPCRELIPGTSRLTRAPWVYAVMTVVMAREAGRTFVAGRQAAPTRRHQSKRAPPISARGRRAANPDAPGTRAAPRTAATTKVPATVRSGPRNCRRPRRSPRSSAIPA